MQSELDVEETNALSRLPQLQLLIDKGILYILYSLIQSHKCNTS